MAFGDMDLGFGMWVLCAVELFKNKMEASSQWSYLRFELHHQPPPLIFRNFVAA